MVLFFIHKYIRFVFVLVILIGIYFVSCRENEEEQRKAPEQVFLGKWTESKLDSIIHESYGIEDVSGQIDSLSLKFLDIQYQGSTLIGSIAIPETLVINLQGIDCFTYIDYVESMRLSKSFAEFKENLKMIRYQSSDVAYEKRNHFFTDWREFNAERIDDVTGIIGGRQTKTVEKKLNEKEDGTNFLPEIPPKLRNIYYVPSEAIDDTILSRLNTGDYAGIYTDIQGLDVTHTGIIIKKGDNVYLRHASSKKINRRVVDEELTAYMANKPGLIVLRPKK